MGRLAVMLLLLLPGAWLIAGPGGELLRFAAPAAAQSPGVVPSGNSARPPCRVQQTQGGRLGVCDLRPPTGRRIISVDVVDADGADVTANYIPYGEIAHKTALLLLVDKSNPRRQQTVERIAQDIELLLAASDDTQTLGLATLADELEVLSAVGATKNDLRAKLAGVRASGLSTELYRLARQAVGTLSSAQADRKALIIFSDGKAEDKGYTRADVVTAARTAGVTIIGLGYAERATETPDLQILRRLAEETGGIFMAANLPAKRLPQGFAAQLLSALKTGGFVHIRLPAQAGDYTIRIRFDDQSVRTAQTSFAAALLQSTELGPFPGVRDKTAFLAWLNQAFDTYRWAIVAASAGLLVLLLWLIAASSRSRARWRRRMREAEAEAQAGEAAGPETVYGWIEFLDGDQTRIEITTRTARLGRHGDNEIHLANKSVSRQHAILHLNPNTNIFTITDLGAANGVLVNDQVTEKAELKDGDLIELGEVRFTFRYADGAA